MDITYVDMKDKDGDITQLIDSPVRASHASTNVQVII